MWKQPDRKRIWMKKRKACLVTALMGAVMLLFAGCGAENKNTSVKEGMTAVKALDYDTALQCFEQAMVNGENQRLLYRGQGLAYMGQTKYDEAVTAFEKALSCGNGQIDEVDYDINYYLAVAYGKLGQTDKSIDVYNAVIAMRPKEKQAYYLRGAMEAPGNFDAAKADFDKAVSLDREDFNQLIDIYLVLQENGYKEAGQEYLQTAVDSDSKAITDYERGRMYYYLEDYDNARNYLEKARETEGCEAVLFLGKTYETLGDFNYAVSVYTDYIDKDQTQPSVYNQLGLCKMKMNAYQEALTAFEDGMKVENNDLMQTLKLNEIIACEYLGEYQKAAVLMGNYLETYPDDETAAREYIFLKNR